MSSNASLCTLDELVALATEALGSDHAGAASGRVRDVPDRRMVRYYTTLGLLDRPAELRGRTAYYGRRHLLQLVAVKRLQAQGLALAEVQQRLLGLTGAELEPLARVPPHLLGTATQPSPTEERSFWKELPADPAPAEQESPAEGWQGISLSEEVLLLLALRRPLREQDREAILAAAAPLLELLRTRQLLRS